MPQKVEYFDISPVLSAGSAVFPGDTAFTRTPSEIFGSGSYLQVSKIESTVHIGAHADAPIHYHAEGQTIDERPVDLYFGKCQVISVKLGRGERIRPEHVRVKIEAPRVLFKTGSFPNPDHWNGDFNSLSPELIQDLAAQGVKLVGIDTPSVDPADSKALESHQAIFKNDLAVLEGIVLEKVADGVYGLMALPLNIRDGDAAPVRAVLVRGNRLWND